MKYNKIGEQQYTRMIACYHVLFFVPRSIIVMIMLCVLFVGYIPNVNAKLGADQGSDSIGPGKDLNFTIVANSDSGFTYFKKKIMVFDIPIYAVYAVEDMKLLHAANILVQYLDNDEWRLYTRSAVQSGDVKAWAIFINPIYNIPKILPNGTHRQ